MGFDEWAVYQRAYVIDKVLMFRLMNTLSYTAVNGARYVVGPGFLTDLGSIPQLFWNILPRDKYPSAFILHDYLCVHPERVSRLDADKILKEALIASGASRFEAQGIYYFVRSYVRVLKPIQILI